VAARAIWKGVLRFADVEVPVKLYSAVEDRKVHFRLLDGKRKQPVEQRMVHPEKGEPVPREEVRKGYEAEPGLFVVLEEEDLAAAEPPPSRDIELTRFVDPDEIDPPWYERPYWLGPDGEEAHEPYFALARALEREGKEGVARWTMRKKGYLGALRTRDGRLMLVTLRHAGEVIAATDLPAPRGRKLAERELAMARQLVEALEDDFRPEEYRDEYRESVRELIAAKAEGKPAKVAQFRPKPPADDLDRALAASLERAKGGRRRAG
jgi:DNA end-binding protein Ku